MAKLVGQDTSKSITGFSATSPGQSGKNFNTGSVPSETAQEFKPSYKSRGIGSSSNFNRAGQPAKTLGDKFRTLAERRTKTKSLTTKPGQSSGKRDLNAASY